MEKQIINYDIKKIDFEKNGSRFIELVKQLNPNEYKILKRGLLGKVVIKRFDNYEEFISYYENVSENCKALTEKNKCKRVLFIVIVEKMTEDMFEQYQKILMIDKRFSMNVISYQVVFIESNCRIGYFGGTEEMGRTLLYRDTARILEKI